MCQDDIFAWMKNSRLASWCRTPFRTLHKKLIESYCRIWRDRREYPTESHKCEYQLSCTKGVSHIIECNSIGLTNPIVKNRFRLLTELGLKASPTNIYALAHSLIQSRRTKNLRWELVTMTIQTTARLTGGWWNRLWSMDKRIEPVGYHQQRWCTYCYDDLQLKHSLIADTIRNDMMYITHA